MCDTMVAFRGGSCEEYSAGVPGEEQRSFFAKNSDREPEELQIVYISTDPVTEFQVDPYIEPVEKYINSSLLNLKAIFGEFKHEYSAVISRPVWMWGAEMGVNEHGLAIGNEALFSKERVSSDGLLGMDILRLALHNNKTAEDALDFIVDLIRECGQGGDGGYRATLKYHNSFLIKDVSEVYVLETSAKHWAAKKIKSIATISNAYTITSDFDSADADSAGVANFKSRHENKLITFFSKGEARQKFSSAYLSAKVAEGLLDLRAMKDLLRAHIGEPDKPKRGMGSICVHSGRLIKSGTTSSFIVEYIHDKCITWFTGSPHPCVSLFKPIILAASGRAAGALGGRAAGDVGGERSKSGANVKDSAEAARSGKERAVAAGAVAVEAGIAGAVAVEAGIAGAARMPGVADAANAVEYSKHLKELSKRIAGNYDLFLKSIKPLRDEMEAEFRKIIYNNIADKTEEELLMDCERCMSLEKEYIKSVESLL